MGTMRAALLGTAAAAVVAAAAMATPTASYAESRELRAGVGFPPNHGWSEAYKFLAEELPKATEGALTVEAFYGSLLSVGEAPYGIRDGIADMGFVASHTLPAELRNTNVVNELAFLGSSATAMMGAISEYMFTCPECLSEYEALNQVYLGSPGTPPFDIMSTKPVQVVEDVEALRVRSASATRWVEAFDGIPVQIAFDETYEAFSQGMIDAVALARAELIGLSLHEMVDYVTDLPLGTYNGISIYSINRQTWQSLTTEQRAAMLSVTSRGVAHTTVGFDRFNDESMAEAAELGVQLLEPDASLLAAHEAFVEADVEAATARVEENYGLADVSSQVERFRALVDKWNGLTADISGDEAALADLLWSEVWSKVDPETHGM